MIDTRKLCKTLNLPEKAFFIQFEKNSTQDFTPFLLSSYLVQRQIEPETVDDEEDLLYEAEMLYSEMIEGLTNELKAIRRFRQSVYGPTDDED